jgi:hypothetical protein
MAESIIGRLAAHPYQPGDPLPALASSCLVSGANCDVDSDQHRAYSWRQVIGYSDDLQFICLQTPGCWPTVERTTNCWFAEIPQPGPHGVLGTDHQTFSLSDADESQERNEEK